MSFDAADRRQDVKISSDSEHMAMYNASKPRPSKPRVDDALTH